jgi:hypothetical protein
MEIIGWSTNKKSKFQRPKSIIGRGVGNPTTSKESKERKKVNKVELSEGVLSRGRERISWGNWQWFITFTYEKR